MCTYWLLKRLLFKTDPEEAHNLVLNALKIVQNFRFLEKFISQIFYFSAPELRFNLMDREVLSPVGLAAGFDKNCELVEVLPSFGFGFLECGTVTARPQEGNPKPRIFRLTEEEALINRLGFNNDGADRIKGRLKNRPACSVPLGISIGKSAATPQENTAQDYLYSFEALYPFADYFAVNVSSPNTPGLRELQKNLSPLLSALQKKNDELSGARQHKPKPIFVKVSPDLTFDELDGISECCLSHNVTGLIATNTTISRDALKQPCGIPGGLSGKPLEKLSTQVLRHLYKAVGKKMILIGAGGIFSAEDAYRKIKAGASLVQLYTGWVYGGPSTISVINRGLAEFLKRDGLNNIQQAVGVEA